MNDRMRKRRVEIMHIEEMKIMKTQEVKKR